MARGEGMLEGKDFGYKLLGTACFKIVCTDNKMLSGMTAQACHPKTGEVEAERLRVRGSPGQVSTTVSPQHSGGTCGGSRVQGHSGPRSEFEDSLDCMRLCHKMTAAGIAEW